MIDVDSEEYKKLEERCRNHSPTYDPERVIQLANALRLMIVQYHPNSKQVKNITCYKSKVSHLKKRRNAVEDF